MYNNLQASLSRILSFYIQTFWNCSLLESGPCKEQQLLREKAGRETNADGSGEKHIIVPQPSHLTSTSLSHILLQALTLKCFMYKLLRDQT